MSSKYHWIITTDHIDSNSKGTVGPRNAPDTIPEHWIKGIFKMYDDDGELYYTGTLSFDPKFEDSEPEVWFFPLEDFGEPNAGAVDIRYKNKNTGKWESM